MLRGNRLLVKSSRMALGLANARPPGSTKFANAPPPGLTRRANAPQQPGGGEALGAAGICLMHKQDDEHPRPFHMGVPQPGP